MLVVMAHGATQEQVDRVCNVISSMGFKPHPMPGANRTAIGITGNPGPIDAGPIEMLPGVAQCIRVTQPYKLVGREFRPDPSAVRVGHTVFGPGHFSIIAGPCAVENEPMIMAVAQFLSQHGVRLMRAGAYKPRTSPYSFQGLGVEGLDILTRARDEFGVGIVTEVMDIEAVDRIETVADML